jgi:hypothetical protein
VIALKHAYFDGPSSQTKANQIDYSFLLGTLRIAGDYLLCKEVIIKDGTY